MGQLTLSRQDIQDDIAAYHHRIRVCRDTLSALPDVKFQSRKDKTTVRVLGSEIDHVTRMVGYARHAMARLEKSDSA